MSTVYRLSHDQVELLKILAGLDEKGGLEFSIGEHVSSHDGKKTAGLRVRPWPPLQVEGGDGYVILAKGTEIPD